MPITPEWVLESKAKKICCNSFITKQLGYNKKIKTLRKT
jgi:hypothetical protein